MQLNLWRGWEGYENPSINLNHRLKWIMNSIQMQNREDYLNLSTNHQLLQFQCTNTYVHTHNMSRNKKIRKNNKKEAKERIKFKEKTELHSKIHKFTSITPSNSNITYSWFLIEIAVRIETLKFNLIERIELIQLINSILINFFFLSVFS
jgi:hypothetical protein